MLIRNTAEATDTFELNRNLVLTTGARADSVPNLEIETGEIAGRRARERHRPLRRRAAVLPAEPRHPGGRRAAAGRPRVLRRGPQQDHHPRAAGAAGGGHRGRARRHRRLNGARHPMSTLEIKDLHVSVATDDGPKEILKGVDLTVDVRPDPRDHGAERLRQVHARLRDRGPPEVRGHRRHRHARRAGRARDDRRRARPRRPVPRHAVPGRGARRLHGQLPALGRHRRPRRGARSCARGSRRSRAR